MSPLDDEQHVDGTGASDRSDDSGAETPDESPQSMGSFLFSLLRGISGTPNDDFMDRMEASLELFSRGDAPLDREDLFNSPIGAELQQVLNMHQQLDGDFNADEALRNMQHAFERLSAPVILPDFDLPATDQDAGEAAVPPFRQDSTSADFDPQQFIKNMSSSVLQYAKDGFRMPDQDDLPSRDELHAFVETQLQALEQIPHTDLYVIDEGLRLPWVRAMTVLVYYEPVQFGQVEAGPQGNQLRAALPAALRQRFPILETRDIDIHLKSGRFSIHDIK